MPKQVGTVRVVVTDAVDAMIEERLTWLIEVTGMGVSIMFRWMPKGAPVTWVVAANNRSYSGQTLAFALAVACRSVYGRLDMPPLPAGVALRDDDDPVGEELPL